VEGGSSAGYSSRKPKVMATGVCKRCSFWVRVSVSHYSQQTKQHTYTRSIKTRNTGGIERVLLTTRPASSVCVPGKRTAKQSHHKMS
jgi:hypothetical protein